MDYETARQLLIDQGNPQPSNPDALLRCLSQQKLPVPGQITTLLLALKVVFTALRDSDSLERELVNALHRLATESRQHYEIGRLQGVEWPPLLDEDLTRIALAVRSIFAGVWQE